MQNNENIMQTTENISEISLTRPESDVTQLEGWKKPCANLHEETDRSMSLIDSCARDLLSYSRGMFKDVPDPEIRAHDSDRVLAAVAAGRAINELMKTKLEAIKVYHDMVPVTVEEDGDTPLPQ